MRRPTTAPQFSETARRIAGPPPRPGQDTRSALPDWGVPAETVAALIEAGVLQEAPATNDHA
jgi:alpha-methylacyl-CoA racemase